MTIKVDGINGLTFADNSTQNVTALNASNITAGTLGKARMATGTVLQVVQSTATASFSTSGTTYVATGLTATITPSSTSSKVLISFTGPAYSGGTNYVYLTVYRNGVTNLGLGSIAALATTGNNPGTYDTSVTSMYLDSPATTSATTYTVYVKSSGGNNAVFGDVSNCGQVMILQEVAA